MRTIQEELKKIKEKNLYRVLKLNSGIDFSSNDYLKLSEDKNLIKKFKEGIELFGLGSTASRLIRGHREIFEELEKKFSIWVNSEASLFVSNGYMANLGLLECLADARSFILTDRLNHASIIDGIRVSNAKKIYFNHNDIYDLETNLRKIPKKANIIVVTESLFSMNGDFCKLDEILRLKKEFQFKFILDEAHSLGIIGEEGSGFARKKEFEAILNLVDFRVFTCGKSMGLEGAFISTTLDAKEYLINSLRTLIFSTAPIPAIAYTLQSSIDLIKGKEEERKKILFLSDLLKKELKSIGYSVLGDTSPILPVLMQKEEYSLFAADLLQKEGFDIRAIRPPTVKESRLRITINSSIDEILIKRLIETFKKIKPILKRSGFEFKE